MICIQCGACCKELRIIHKTHHRRELEFYRARGFRVVGGTVFINVEHRCPQLTDANKCRLHGTGKKPYMCKTFPAGNNMGALPPTCGYNKESNTSTENAK